MPPSSQLPPLDAILLPESEQADRGLWWRGCGLVMGVVLLGVVGIGGLIYLTLNSSQRIVFKHETLEEKQQQLRAGYSPTAQADHPDRRGIERFLARVVTASSKEDQRQFRQLVDFDELHKRALQHPQMPKLNYIQQLMLKTQLEQEEGLGQYNRLRLVSLQVIDAEHVIACTLAEGDYGHEEAWRLWLRKRGNNWLLVDWEVVDFGYSTSDRAALFQAATSDPLYSQYQQSEAHVQQSRQFRGNQKLKEAADQLRLAANCPMPALIADLQRYFIMLEWRELQDHRETIAICQQAPPDTRSPGFQHQLAVAHANLEQHAEAIAATLAHERAAGFHPQVVKIRARALEELGRNDEALVAYEQLQTLTPTDATLIPDLYRLLPEERKAEWLEYVAQSAEPVELAVAQAAIILGSHDDQATARKLMEFVATQAPDSPDLLHIRSLLLESDGEHEQAAALFRQAAEQAVEEEDKQDLWWRYLTAMREAGKTLDVLKEHPDPDRAFNMLTDGFDEDEGMLPVRELRPFLAAQLARNPEDRQAHYLAGELARRAGDLASAKQHLEKVTTGESEDEEYLRSQAESTLHHIAVLEGRAVQVLRQAADQPSTYQELAGAALSEKDWQTLQQLNAFIQYTPTAQQNAWYSYYEAKLALRAKAPERAVQQMLLAKIQEGEGPKNPGKYYIDYLEAEILSEAYGLLEAYGKHPNQRNAFSRYHHQALSQHDWPTAAALCALHKQAHADDPQLLLAEVETARQQGKYEEVVQLLEPFPDAARFGGQWQIVQAQNALIESLAHLQRTADFDAVATSIPDPDRAKLQLLQLLRQGDAAGAGKLLGARKRTQRYLFSSLFTTHPQEISTFQQDPRLAPIFLENGAPVRDELSGAGLVLLAGETAPWSIDKLREQFIATVPGLKVGEPHEHASGVSYALTIPGGEACRFQLTIGNSPYTTRELVNDEVILPQRLRAMVEAQRSWLALESSATQPPAAIDESWRLLRQLAAAICDEQTLAVGYREPEAYQTTFVLRDAGLPAIVRSEKPLQLALADRPSSTLPFASRQGDEQTPQLKKQLQKFTRQWRNKTAQPPTEVRVAIDHGHRREQAWFRVVNVEHAQYSGDEILADLIPAAATADILPAGRYQFFGNEVRELRAGE